MLVFIVGGTVAGKYVQGATDLKIEFFHFTIKKINQKRAAEEKAHI